MRSLYPRLACAVMAHYLNLGSAARAAAYSDLVRHFEARGKTSRAPREPGRGALACDLDRARWSLRYALHTRPEELEAALNKAVSVFRPSHLQQ